MTDSRVLRFPASKFHELVQKMPELTERLVGMMSDRIRETTRMEQQRDRLAALGKLSAGLAHELNNPASAAKRAASQLRDILKKIATRATNWEGATSPPRRKRKSKSWKPRIIQHNEPPPDTLAMSDLEEQLDSLLRSHGQNDLWQLAAGLARNATSSRRCWNRLFADARCRHGARGAGANRRFGRGLRAC